MFLRAVLLALLVLGLAAPAHAGYPLLSGVWEGSISCKTEDADGRGSVRLEVTLLIDQTDVGGPLAANVIGGSVQHFAGTAIQTETGRGSGALIACGTSDATTASAVNVIERFDYKLDTRGEGGSLKTTGVEVTNGEAIAVCKGSFQRTSAITPKIVSCDAL